MQISCQLLKPLSTIALTSDEEKILKWIRGAKWEAVAGARDPIPYKAKVPEFFSGVRLYKVQGGATTGAGAMGALDLFIKKIEFQGVISKQEMYPVITQGTSRFLMLKKMDMENLGVGADEDDD
ncbi:MAG: hypothetical protein EBR02_02680 [Alphaproteobacteria bacterium]|nr:hypothetical protein [Alphaproteobacteria bacterium]